MYAGVCEIFDKVSILPIYILHVPCNNDFILNYTFLLSPPPNKNQNRGTHTSNQTVELTTIMRIQNQLKVGKLKKNPQVADKMY